MKQHTSADANRPDEHKLTASRYRRLPRRQRMHDVMREQSIRAQKTADTMARVAEQNWQLRRFLRDLLFDTGFVAALNEAGVQRIPRMLVSRIVCVAQDGGPFAALAPVQAALFAGSDASGHPFVAPEHLPHRTSDCLARMSHLRKRQVFGLMQHTRCYTGDFAMALLATTPVEEQLSNAVTAGYDSRFIASLARCERKLQISVQVSRLLGPEHPLMLVEQTIHLVFGRELVSRPLVRGWLERRAPEYINLLRKCGVADVPRRTPRRPLRVAR